MIRLVTPENRTAYAHQLEEMHRQRWVCFVEQRGWSALGALQKTPGYEEDEFDDERAVYLLALSQQGNVLGSMRLRPADDKTIVGDICQGAIDAKTKAGFGASDWEITRTMRAPAHTGPDGQLRLQLTTAACEFALDRGISRYVCCVDTQMLPAMRALNREHHTLLGEPIPYAEGEMIAVALRPDQQWLERTYALAGFTGRVLEAPPRAAAFAAA